jgi:hypothetical protein
VPLNSELQAAFARLEEARRALKTASDEVPSYLVEPGKSRKYELTLMSEEVLDISDRLMSMMHALDVSLRPPA